jgi:hypothetical protein
VDAWIVAALLPAALTGALSRARWTVWVWPALFLVAGAAEVLREQPGYDMHGAGLAFGAVLAVVAWLGGRAIRNLSGFAPSRH